MLTIVLCDDNDILLETLKEVVETYLSEKSISARIITFQSSQELLDTKEEYDIYILDVIMPEPNGIELGKLIKQQNKYSKIIYFSASPDYALESYEVDAECYLLKPLDPIKLFTVLDRTRKNIREESTFIKTATGEKRVKTEDILYVDIIKRCLCFHMADGSVIFGQTMRASFEKSMQDLVDNEAFKFLKPSLLINLAAIKILDKDNIIFSTEEKLYYPKTNYKALQEAWISRYVKRK